MPRAALTGSRIRRFRLDRGVRQADLARDCDISPSYLNLIEHNRRRIGGALLNRIARALDVDPVVLSEGASATLTSGLEAVAANAPAGEGLEPPEDFAGTFPGWARLAVEQQRRSETLERVVEVLNDRLTHDPMLSASLHDVLSTVTAIRSTSGILASGEEIEPEWNARFVRNLYEDSQRLAQSAEALVGYLDAGGDAARRTTLPQEELEAWLDAQGWNIGEIEAGADPSEVLAASGTELATATARSMAATYLTRYAADAESVPMVPLLDAIELGRTDPAALAGQFKVGFDLILRRLAQMPDSAFRGGLAPGLVLCDASGTLTFRKPVEGFEPPHFGSGCALWPLYEALARPSQPIRTEVVLTGRDTRQFTLHAFATTRFPAGFDRPGVVEATMLIVPRVGDTGDEMREPLEIGTSCRVCARGDCPARREPSILSLARAGA
ncbi:DUF2083 domain-containing protein [Alphaproteobacteria bacterium GH1-50]|uniref:DUF2083 domain-containing protein n=1 Tax=Kangsaoukella pontilimi TaxID=2691042 RepID=A0A7C9IGA7_9RHOB|nr:helix-turn-helix transcriptional regulator [Kangsaoukella pontilimi]MXQ06762.1 DUF2083 domain-containing protein [Kangsaoukella pontilimi]